LLKTMLIRRTLAAVALLAVSLAGARAQKKIARDWTKAPAVAQSDTRATIFAVGDVHGDYDRLLRLLKAAGLVEAVPADAAKVRWSGGKATLVITGDMIDKGPKCPEVLQLVQRLRAEAAAAGGQVVALAGNHEVDFLRNPLSEKAAEFAGQLKAAGFDPKAVGACQGELGAFLCSLPFAARVNDWFFSHAGNSGGRTMSQLIADLQSGVDKDGFDTAQLTGANSVVLARMGALGPGGKAWFETGNPRQGGAQTLADYIKALGVAHVVQGHHHGEVRFPDGKRRKVGEIYQWRGRLFLIDAGMSQDIDDSHGAVLRIRPGEASAICPDGRITRLWSAQQPDASKGVRCGW
jgi:hypothetical protein